MDKIFGLMQQPKANQEEKLRFDMKDIRRYFPKNYSTEKIQQTILRLLEKYERNWRRNFNAFSSLLPTSLCPWLQQLHRQPRE